jgi:hypothetical protein
MANQNKQASFANYLSVLEQNGKRGCVKWTY